jgi:hypothetical protein
MPADKARYVVPFHRSGKTVAAFCEAMDLSPTTFATWDVGEDVQEAQVGGRLAHRLRTLVFPSLMIIDEIGYHLEEQQSVGAKRLQKRDLLRLDWLRRDSLTTVKRPRTGRKRPDRPSHNAL